MIGFGVTPEGKTNIDSLLYVASVLMMLTMCRSLFEFYTNFKSSTKNNENKLFASKFITIHKLLEALNII